MGKPSQQNATTTAINPVQTAQQPYLNYGWGEAKNLYQNDPQQYYPGQTLAPWIPPNPAQTQGYQDLYNTAANVQAGMFPTANTAWQQAASGQYGGQANPANQYYEQLASGTSPLTQAYQTLQNQAQVGGNQYGQAIGQYVNPMMGFANQAASNNNLGLSQLGRTAGGAYLDPSTNPYMTQMVQSAMDPVTRNYQTSVAPSLDAAASAAGRYGSGTQAGLASTAQQNLGKSLSDLSGNLYGQQFARERQAQDAAAQNYGQLYNSGLGLGMTGVQNAANIQGQAGNQFWQGQQAAQAAANQYGQANLAGIQGLGTNYNQGAQNSLEALRQYPQLQQAAYAGPQAAIQAGQGLTGLDQQYRGFLQQQIQDEMARYYGVQAAPWKTLEQYSGLIGNPVGGSETKTTPYFSNPMGSAISGIAGLAGAGSSLGLWGAGAGGTSALAGLGLMI